MTRTRRDSQGLRVGYDVDLKDPYKTDTRRENNDETTTTKHRIFVIADSDSVIMNDCGNVELHCENVQGDKVEVLMLTSAILEVIKEELIGKRTS